MSELFGNNPRVKPAKEWAPVMQGAGSSFTPFKADAPAIPAAAPAPKPKDVPLSQQTPLDTLGKAARKPTILSASAQSNTPIAAMTYGGNKLG